MAPAAEGNVGVVEHDAVRAVLVDIKPGGGPWVVGSAPVAGVENEKEMPVNRLCGTSARRWARLGMGVALAGLLCLVVLLWGARAARPVAPAQQTIRIEFPYPGGDPDGVSAAADDFAGMLSQETGLDIQTSFFPCVAGIVRHLGEERADVAPIEQVSYIRGHEAYTIEARLVNERFGFPYYRGQINAQASGGYTDVWSLQNTRFAAPDAMSWSGYYVPYVMISETTGMTPGQFFSEVVFAGGHNEVIEVIYNDDADCGGSFQDARGGLVGMYTDVFTVVEVITVTPSIPQSPWAFRPGLDATTVQSLTQGIIAVSETSTGTDALGVLMGYPVSGITETQDSAYDYARKIVTVFDLQMAPCYSINLPLAVRDGP